MNKIQIVGVEITLLWHPRRKKLIFGVWEDEGILNL